VQQVDQQSWQSEEGPCKGALVFRKEDIEN